MRESGVNRQCKSVRCCCNLICKSKEKPTVEKMSTRKRNDGCGGRMERPQISLSDFLKSQPIPDWIKVTDVRPKQQHQQHRPQNEQCSLQPTADVQEDLQSSQIIINFGTVLTSRVCKRDSCQQTDSEVQGVVVPKEKKQRKCLTMVSSLNNLSKTTCPLVNRSNSTYPPVNRSTAICPSGNRSTSNFPLTNRTTYSCPPSNLSTYNSIRKSVHF